MNANTTMRDDFRKAMSHFATGVAVVTAQGEQGAQGATISALSSVSLDPVLLLVCLNRKSSTYKAIAESGRFALSILSKNQEDKAYFFASPALDKNVETETLCHENGSLFVKDALVHISCSVKETLTGGSHEIFLGSPDYVKVTGTEPLLYFKGGFNLF